MVISSVTWLSTPADLAISNNTIEVWRCPLDSSAAQLKKFASYLSEPERQRAERFRFDDKRCQFVTTRAQLRQCLAIATGTPAEQLEIATDSSGKPFLVEGGHASEIQFNVSHTDSLALIAITRGHAVGIDVESLAQNVRHKSLAEHYFSVMENEAIAALPPEQVAASFFACWTRKEAVLKAIGTGIAHGLDSFDVAIGREKSHCVTQIRSADGKLETWRIETLFCGDGFAGALAFQPRQLEIRCWSPVRDTD